MAKRMGGGKKTEIKTTCYEAAASTNSEDGRKEDSQLVEENEGGRRHAQPGMGHHSGVGEGERAHHTGAPRRDDEGVGNLPSGDVGESGGHSHPVHSRDPDGWGLESAHGNGRGDCSHEAEGSGGRNHPWELGRGGEGESETGMDHAGVPQRFGPRFW